MDYQFWALVALSALTITILGYEAIKNGKRNFGLNWFAYVIALIYIVSALFE